MARNALSSHSISATDKWTLINIKLIIVKGNNLVHFISIKVRCHLLFPSNFNICARNGVKLFISKQN